MSYTGKNTGRVIWWGKTEHRLSLSSLRKIQSYSISLCSSHCAPSTSPFPSHFPEPRSSPSHPSPPGLPDSLTPALKPLPLSPLSAVLSRFLSSSPWYVLDSPEATNLLSADYALKCLEFCHCCYFASHSGYKRFSWPALVRRIFHIKA